VREVIVGEVLARQQVIDKSKTLLRTFAHGNGNCAVQFDNRGWLNPQQAVVEQRNLAPVRGCRGGTLGVNGRNGRLQSVGAEAARSLLEQQDRSLWNREQIAEGISLTESALRRIKSPSGEVLAARRDSCSSMSPNRPITSGSWSRSSRSLPRRIASRLSSAPVVSAEYPR
jgi:hypothetical protein